MRNILKRRHTHKEPTRNATEEVLEELKQEGDEDDVDIAEPTHGGTGDPISPSPQANRRTAEGHPDD
ncbi:hypothetical protein [Streptomyces griseus]|uniref:hypothetical protein n=1 Tax=Streptomyces griseus TaxID=1911 RepID=UPI0005611F02|nr:hypothetical protein [Streptomyces griseus]